MRRLTKDQFSEMDTMEFLKFSQRELMPSNKKKGKLALNIIFPYDLRSSLEMKRALTEFKWLAYVNNSGTLAHVVSPEG